MEEKEKQAAQGPKEGQDRRQNHRNRNYHKRFQHRPRPEGQNPENAGAVRQNPPKEAEAPKENKGQGQNAEQKRNHANRPQNRQKQHRNQRDRNRREESDIRLLPQNYDLGEAPAQAKEQRPAPVRAPQSAEKVQTTPVAAPIAEDTAPEMPQDVLGEQPVEAPKIEEPIEVVGVHFRRAGKVYYFDPHGLQLRKGTHVITQTANGIEFCEVAMENRMIPGANVVQPLRPVLRIATAEDERRVRENSDKEVEAYNTCVRCIAEHGLNMKLVETELSFDRSKLLFYFISEERVDFRNLVKELAAIFHVRIELRQIGIRDEAKLLGGLGVCGRPLCCSTFLPDFAQVSIKMAKEQNLSLNAAKISGTCGRLMCCLRFEHVTYEEELKRTPKVDSIVQTPDGEGVVTESNPLTGLLKVRMRQNPEDAPKVFVRESVVVSGYQKGLSQKMLQEKQQKSEEKRQKS